MDLRSLSGLARPVDMSYASNRRVAMASAGVMIAAWIISGLAGAGWLSALGTGALAALGFFLAWALGRELDPDQDGAALLAAALTLPGLALAGVPNVGALFLILLGVRVVNRTTGLAATPLDVGLLVVLGLLVAAPVQPVYLIAAGMALVVDGVISPPSRRRVIIGVGAAVVAAAGLIVLLPDGPRPQPGLWPSLLALAIAGAFMPVILAQAKLTSLADDTSEPLSRLRVRAGQLLALGTAVATALWQGDAGVTALLPLWAALLATAAWRLRRAGPAAGDR